MAERTAAKTPKLCTPSAVRLTATSSGISVDEAAVIAAEAAAAGDTAPAALARVFPKARLMLLSLGCDWHPLHISMTYCIAVHWASVATANRWHNWL